MKRRQFVYRVLSGIASIYLMSAFKSVNSKNKITILHTNDTHSRIDPFPDNDAKYPGLGGVAKRKTIIDAIRQNEEQVLLLDAGDIFQGTPYFNMFHGELEMQLMSAMQYDAATMGNHDFDIGLEGFLNAKQFADFPFLCANYDFSNTILKDKTQPFKIFEKGNWRVGIFGIGVELKGLVPDTLFGETKYLNPIETAQQYADKLKLEENCDLVICLSHLGHKLKLNTMCDPVLAKQTSNIDLIIGGHSHTFMEKPEEHLNKEGKTVLINQVGWAGIALGRIDFYKSKANKDLSYQFFSDNQHVI